MRKDSVKNNRINEEVFRELANIIRSDLKDPRISPLTSVLSVEVAPDLKTCKAYISCLGGKEELDSTIKGLKSSAGYIRRELAHRINLRNTPEITFIGDSSIAYAQDMFKKIEDLNIKYDEEEDSND